jgi:magnesium chelatase subunit D
MRADLVVARTAMAHAAWRGADTVAERDVQVAARLALPHRGRRDPFDEPGLDEDRLAEAMRDAAEQLDGDQPDDQTDGPDDDPSPDGGPHGGPGGGAPQPNGSDDQSTSDGPSSSSRQRPSTPTPAFRARLLQVPGIGDGAPGRRSRSRARTGRTVRSSTVDGAGLHLIDTLAAAAPHQRDRGRTGPGLVLRGQDVRLAVREGREGNLVLFVVDASGSMAARARMSAVTGAVLSLLRDAYQRRDKVGVITFRGDSAETVLPPTSSVDAAARRLAALRTGGRTPLAEGLLRARKVLAAERLRDPRRRPLLVLLTDGRATSAASGRDALADALAAAALLLRDGIASVTVDCEHGPVRLGLAGRVAAAAGGAVLTMDQLSADQVAGVVRAARAA